MADQSFDQVIAELREPIPESVGESTEADMVPWRDRIDQIDIAVIVLLNKRAQCAAAIGRIKNKLGLPVYHPPREEDVLNNVMASNPGPLPDEAVRRLYERIIDETRSLERKLYDSDGGKAGENETDGKVSKNGKDGNKSAA